MTHESLWIALGDSALRAKIPTGIAHRPIADALKKVAGVKDVVMTEEHVAVYFDALQLPEQKRLDDAIVIAEMAVQPATHRIQVRYDGEDLPELSNRLGMSVDAIISAHSEQEYVVKMIGFMPGFAYLGGLCESLRLPRRANPRNVVPANSVAMAGGYTGVYPMACPGGWHLLGAAREPHSFSLLAEPPLEVGDKVIFEKI